MFPSADRPFSKQTMWLLREHLQLFLLLGFPALCHNAPADEQCGSACGMVALVPARGGSKGLPLKNIAMLNNQTLLARTLRIIQSSTVFSSVWVSTDADSIAKEAEAVGVNVHWRAPETGLDNATTLSVVEDFLSSHPEVGIIAVVQCTSPFLCPNWLDKAARVMTDSSVDCVFAVTRSFKLRWSVPPDRYAIAENFSPVRRPRRQDWQGELFESGMFYFSRRRLIAKGLLQNDRCKVVEVPVIRSMEIDTAVDLEVAKFTEKILPPC